MFPPSRVAEIARLWAERAEFLAALEGLPQTRCHHDAHRGNLLGRPKGTEAPWPVAIDGAFTGSGAVGEELVPMAVLFGRGPAPRTLEARCFAAYVAGLRAAGWAGDAELVRLGYAAAGALRDTVGARRLYLPAFAEPTLHPLTARVSGRPTAEAAAAAMGALLDFEIELAEEARTILRRLA